MHDNGIYMQEYEINPDFKTYVDRYCRRDGISVEEALKHMLVKEVAESYRVKRETVSECKQ